MYADPHCTVREIPVYAWPAQLTNLRTGVAYVLGASVCIAYEEAAGFYCAGHSSLRSGATGQLVQNGA